MSERFEAVVYSAVVAPDDSVDIKIMAGSIAARRRADCQIMLKLSQDDAKLYPAGAKVEVTLDSELDPKDPLEP